MSSFIYIYICVYRNHALFLITPVYTGGCDVVICWGSWWLSITLISCGAVELKCWWSVGQLFPSTTFQAWARQSEGSLIECQVLNPVIAPACKMAGLKCAHTPANSIFSGPVISDFNSVFRWKSFHMLPWKAEGFQISHFYWLLFKWHHSSEKVKTGNGVAIRCYRTAQSHQMMGMENGLGGNSPWTQKAPLIYGSGKPHSVAVSFPLGEVWWVGRLFKCEEAHTHTSNRHVHMHTHTHNTHTQGGKRHLKIHHAFIQQKWPRTIWWDGHLFNLHMQLENQNADHFMLSFFCVI